MQKTDYDSTLDAFVCTKMEFNKRKENRPAISN